MSGRLSLGRAVHATCLATLRAVWTSEKGTALTLHLGETDDIMKLSTEMQASAIPRKDMGVF